MSVPATGGVPTSGAGEEAIELPPGDAAFASLMDALAPEPETGEAAAPAAGDGAAADAPAVPGADTSGGSDAAAGRPTAGDAAPGTGAGAAGNDAASGTGGAAAGDPAGAAADGGGAGLLPPEWTAAAADLVPKLGELSTALEENTAKAYQAQAYEAVRGEHGNYFDALEKHPRLLVGTDVPAIGKEGLERLQSTQDAKDWQDAVKSLLVEEIRDRAGRQLEESQDFLQTVHASIELFQNNTDLVPGTKDFDVELANEFTKLAEPYEVRVEGKLQGYSIPVQPIIESLRAQVASRRAAAPAAAPATGTAPPTSPAQSAPEAPQAGIPSKAGNSDSREDFSTLFGTIGLPNLQI